MTHFTEYLIDNITLIAIVFNIVWTIILALNWYKLLHKINQEDFKTFYYTLVYSDARDLHYDITRIMEKLNNNTWVKIKLKY